MARWQYRDAPWLLSIIMYYYQLISLMLIVFPYKLFLIMKDKHYEIYTSNLKLLNLN